MLLRLMGEVVLGEKISKMGVQSRFRGTPPTTFQGTDQWEHSRMRPGRRRKRSKLRVGTGLILILILNQNQNRRLPKVCLLQNKSHNQN